MSASAFLPFSEALRLGSGLCYNIRKSQRPDILLLFTASAQSFPWRCQLLFSSPPPLFLFNISVCLTQSSSLPHRPSSRCQSGTFLLISRRVSLYMCFFFHGRNLKSPHKMCRAIAEPITHPSNLMTPLQPSLCAQRCCNANFWQLHKLCKESIERGSMDSQLNGCNVSKHGSRCGWIFYSSS